MIDELLFKNNKIKLIVSIKDETIWLSLEQMSQLFERDKTVISKHIKASMNEELNNISTVAKFATVQKEGNRFITRYIEYYNLDVIISVGYRVHSSNGIIFRQWANKTLKEKLISNYLVDQNKMIKYEKTVRLINIVNRTEKNILNSNASDILNVLCKYNNALQMIENYDNKTFIKNKGTISSLKISYYDCIKIIELLKKKEKSNLFALERPDGLISIINDIYQTYDRKDVYEYVEEKCAVFLYLLVKNHIFIDGNKRIAAALFIYALQFYSLLYKNNQQLIDNNALTAITLLIAQSNPCEKELIIELIINFLSKN